MLCNGHRRHTHSLSRTTELINQEHLEMAWNMQVPTQANLVLLHGLFTPSGRQKLVVLHGPPLALLEDVVQLFTFDGYRP